MLETDTIQGRKQVNSPTLTPQPGAQKNPMLGLGLPPRDVAAANWRTLPAREAVNFTHAKPHLLNAGESLYRVYGGAAGISGGYWSLNPPASDSTEAQWRRENAVELSWNTGTSVAKFTATAPLQIWTGGVESQPAQDNEGKTLPDYWLVGEGTQFWVMSYPAPIFPTPTTVGPTPWATTASVPLNAVELVARPEELNTSDPHAVQAKLVAQLAQSLQLIAESLTTSSSNAGSLAAAQLAFTVANLMRSANALIENLGGSPSVLKTMTRAQVGLGRYVQIDHNWKEAAYLNRTLDAVVHGAAKLAGIAT